MAYSRVARVFYLLLTIEQERFILPATAHCYKIGALSSSTSFNNFRIQSLSKFILHQHAQQSVYSQYDLR